MYNRVIKRIIDCILAGVGSIILLPVFIIVAVTIVIDDPGPVLFKQKRIGKNKKLFWLHKFRSMKVKTPDIPTHLLENPDQYITRVGHFLRKSSLDELPQLYDILRGKMSIVGPRPALWNQDDLIAERDKYGANDIMPGLTGWAQINGRDELEIVVKAKFDGEYVTILQSGGTKAFAQDIRCIFGTVKSVLKKDGIVEGGTGTGHKNNRMDIERNKNDYGYLKKFCIDRNLNKNVLITGADSYIGECFKIYACAKYKNIVVDVIDVKSGVWKERDFTAYDTVFHVAGIAHVDTGRISEDVRNLYYMVNRDLAIEIARKCKTSGVKQFIFMSSMIIYGNDISYKNKKIINECTVPKPTSYYADSKWQADMEVRKLQSENFKVAVIRSPMVYGKDCKGNYQLLARLARKLPIFPDVNNERSMIYIENLCEFICLLTLSGKGGIFFPQNKQYSSTCELVKLIGQTTEHDICMLKLLNPLVNFAAYIPGKIGYLIEKAFGNCVYSQKLSSYDGMDYQVINLEESIRKTEGK